MSSAGDGRKESQGSSVYTALAQTTSRALALYFSRPARLFRPAKGLHLLVVQEQLIGTTTVSGWHSLKGQALQSGTSLNGEYLYDLVKKQGVSRSRRSFSDI